jgi:hypothetical protein
LWGGAKTFPKMTISEKFDDMVGTWLALYDRLEHGESVEQINLDLDIVAAGYDWHPLFRENLRNALESMKQHRDEGGDRNELLQQLKEAKAKYLAGTLED